MSPNDLLHSMSLFDLQSKKKKKKKKCICHCILSAHFRVTSRDFVASKYLQNRAKTMHPLAALLYMKLNRRGENSRWGGDSVKYFFYEILY